MLAGIVTLIVGIATQNPTALGVGVVLGALGGLEVSVREHFAGYRSHTTLLAGAVFVLTVGALFYLAGLDPGDLPRRRRRRLRDHLPRIAAAPSARRRAAFRFKAGALRLLDQHRFGRSRP